MSRSKPLPGIEINEDFEIVTPVSQEKDFKDVVRSELFMHETLVITVAASTNENDPPYANPQVGTSNQPILRGVPTEVKRKYVEVMARAKETRYVQIQNPFEPDRSELVARDVPVYAFTVDKDPNPLGPAWLRHVLAEPA